MTGDKADTERASSSEVEYTGRSDARRYSVMGRRRFMDSLASLGLSASALGLLSKDAVAAKTDDPSDEIVIPTKVQIKNPEKLRDGVPKDPPHEMETITERVPYEEWARTEAAHDAALRVADGLRSKFGQKPGRVLVRTSRGGRASKEVVVRTSTDAAVQSVLDTVPATVQGKVGSGRKERTVGQFPVAVEPRPVSYDQFDSQYRPVPGGCEIWGYDSSDNCSNGLSTNGGLTSFQAFYNGDAGEYQLATAGHGFENGGTVFDGWTQAEPTSCDLDRQVGTEWNYRLDAETDNNGNIQDVNFDAGLLSSSGASFNTKLADSGGSYKGEIAGYYTWSKVKQEEGNSSWTVNLQGISSGVVSGHVTAVDPEDKFFTTSFNAQGGDSGGSYYRLDSANQINTIGIHSYSPSSGSSGATGMHLSRILDEWNLYFV